jgi:hypothetical protein
LFELLNLLFPAKLLGVVVKPLVRLILGLIVAPLFRLFLRGVVRKKDLDEELEKDLSLWIRGSLMLLIASSNMESFFFGWVPLEWREDKVFLVAARLLLAIGVVEGMPDQALFAIIHPGPPKLKLQRGRIFAGIIGHIRPFCWGILCQHFNRSSPVLAILTVFYDDHIGWICYGMAITNYLIIGLVSSRDKALDVLQQFDHAVTDLREELVEEIQSHEGDELSPEQRLAAAEQAGPFPVPLDGTDAVPSSSSPPLPRGG